MAIHESLLTSAPIPEAGQDADLIRTCNTFAAIEIMRQSATWTDEQEAAVFDDHQAAFSGMFEHRATTQAGLLARARAIGLYCYANHSSGYDGQMIGALLSDMLALPDLVEGCAG